MKEYNIVLATDSFKGSASSKQVEDWLELGIRKVLPNCTIHKFPIADGGEGTVDAITSTLGGQFKETQVKDPLGNEIVAKYGLLDSQTAVIEMAESSGITLIEQSNENALVASTYGVGQLILAAIADGVTEIYLGLGGSATSDGGIGMAQALGVSFKDKEGNEISSGVNGIKDLVSIDISGISSLAEKVKIRLLSDVTNPLTGKNGTINVYGPQKGILPEQIQELDSYMVHYGSLLHQVIGEDIANQPGAGAAGGLGAGLLAFCGAEFNQGIDEILHLLKVEQKIQDASLVITGEGRMDSQSANGKAPVGIAKLAKKYEKPVIAVVGGCEGDLTPVYEAGIDLVLSVLNRPMPLEEAILQVEDNVVATGETAIRAFLLNTK